MLADKPDALATMLAVPTPVLALAALLPVAVPLTTELVSLLTKPETVCVKAGLAAPYKRFWLSALTVRGALLMVSVPLLVVKS